MKGLRNMPGGLNNHLFAQLKKRFDEKLTGEHLDNVENKKLVRVSIRFENTEFTTAKLAEAKVRVAVRRRKRGAA